MRGFAVFILIFYMIQSEHSSNARPFILFQNIKKNVFDKYTNFLKKGVSFLQTTYETGKGTQKNRGSEKEKQFLNTLVKLCESEMGSPENRGLDITVGAQNIKNLNTIKNNITMPEIKMPAITVVIVKDAKELAKYQEKNKNTNNATIIIQSAKPKAAPRTAKKISPDVKKCVLMKVEDLKVIKT
ncbi:uncharacterized protein LOC108038231 [Drosophila rhopaloa]|uniref:Uncharacterized protein LOC108038231 n=1 Tax=Drosophila rhopaloa TaxID=1041015 RepID=A0A6P4E248_DRORH|nr:uncharacterized protein LOC108038231 [Drosophila rhopaloa]